MEKRRPSRPSAKKPSFAPSAPTSTALPPIWPERPASRWTSRLTAPRKGDGLDPWEGDIRVDLAKLEAIAAEARQKREPIFEFAAENGTNGTCPVLSPDEVADVIRDMNGTKSKPKADTVQKQMQRAETLGVLRKAERGKWSINPTGQTGHERDK